ncbi:VOC family protein [Paenibacillus filicis]|uniref:VOC family protein n=1 Tax=Paenibacillus filicis TaxID=669464 RepID=A0ABU9DMN6_9BACL
MKIKEIVLGTNQLDAIQAFYVNRLGLEVAERGHGQLSLRAGETILSFHEIEASAAPFYHIAFTIPTNQLSEAKRWAVGRGITLFSNPEGQDEFSFPAWDATAVYFHDPDGNLIEFIAHHSLDTATEEPFDTGHLLRISEIGLPVREVPGAAADIQEAFGFQRWGGDGQQFAPIGDAEGLFIVVKHTRSWFPDGSIPVIARTRVTVEGGKSGQLRLEDGRYELISV